MTALSGPRTMAQSTLVERSPAQRRAPASFDAASFEAFHAATARRLVRYLTRVGGDPALAEDLLQEAYLRFLGRPLEAAEPRQREAYLFRIATNLLHDRWRREAVHRSWLSRQDPVSETAPAGGPSLRLDLQAVLNRLPQRSRALLWLLYVEGYDHREAAKILGLAATSVRVMAFRARRKLARWLEQAGFDPAPERLASQDSGAHAEDQETSP